MKINYVMDINILFSTHDEWQRRVNILNLQRWFPKHYLIEKKHGQKKEPKANAIKEKKNRTLSHHSFPFIFIWNYLLIFFMHSNHLLVFLQLLDTGQSRMAPTFCAPEVNWSQPHSYGNCLTDFTYHREAQNSLSEK